jgi:putative ABC transport system permease protein
MLFSENFKIAIRALRANKLRSVLTMLGIVIGVATVVALLSIGKGATASITSDIQSSGTNLLTVSAGRSQMGPPDGGASQQESHLYYSDYELLQRGLVDNVTVIVPSYQSSYIIKFGDQSFNVILLQMATTSRRHLLPCWVLKLPRTCLGACLP